MRISFLVSTISFAFTISAFPLALEPLIARFDSPYTLSSCRFNPRFLAFHTQALTSPMAKAEVTITNKLTEEKGDVGSGLHDNLIGECGRDQVTNWQTPTVLATEKWTERVVAYSVWFDVGSTKGPGCITRAIQKAEGQTVRCTML